MQFMSLAPQRRALGVRLALSVFVGALVAALAMLSTSGNARAQGRAKAAAGTSLDKYIGHPSPAECGGRKYVFGYDTFSNTDAFAVPFSAAIKRVAKQMGCVKIDELVDNANAGQAVQNAQVFAEKHVNGVLLFNVISSAGPGVAQALNQAHIPAVTIVVNAPGETFVTNNDAVDGKMAGRALVAAWKKQPKKTPVYAIIGRYDAQGPTGIARMNGVITGFNGAVPKSHIFQFDTNDDPSTAESGTHAILGKIPKNATILMTGINDDTVYAMFQAAKQAGRANHTLVSGMATTQGAGLNFICKNPSYVGGSGFFPEDWAKYMIPALVARVRGDTVPSKIVVPTHFIYRNDIKKYYPKFKCGAK